MQKWKTRLAAAVVVTIAGLTIATPAHAGIVGFEEKAYAWEGSSPFFGYGWRMDFGRGTDWVGARYNDSMSSLQVRQPANYAILYENIRYGGIYSVTFYSGTDDLDYWKFNDITSSIG